MTPREQSPSSSRTQARTPTRRRADVRTEATRAAILNAATRLFAERGYRDTTLATIADQVGITDAGILHHYHTKDQLLQAVVESIYAAHEQRFDELTRPGGLAAIRNLSQWGHVVGDRLSPAEALVLVLSAEAVAQDTFIHDFSAAKYKEFTKRIAALMRTGIRNGEIRGDVDVAHEARSLLAHLLGTRFLWMYLDKGFAIGSALERHVDDVVQRIRAPRRGRRTATLNDGARRVVGAPSQAKATRTTSP